MPRGEGEARAQKGLGSWREGKAKENNFRRQEQVKGALWLGQDCRGEGSGEGSMENCPATKWHVQPCEDQDRD